MLSKGSQRLADDHVAVDKLLKQIQAAIESGNVRAAYEKTDLFWARLAVHIRAEHLHLFPALSDSAREGVIERLRVDHDFFMRKLANAVEGLRTLTNVTDPEVINKGLGIVSETIRAVEQKLVVHNQIEEAEVYGLVGAVLNAEEQVELAEQVNHELENRPPRFAAAVW